MIIGMLISIVTLIFPTAMSIIASLGLLLFPFYLMIRQIIKFIASKGQNISNLIIALLALVGLIIIISMFIKRIDKIRNLPVFLKISSIIIKS